MDQKQKPVKAYKNSEFLNSRAARTIRIMAEFYEPMSRFQNSGIESSIVFFGSARSRDMESVKVENIKDEKAIRMAQYYEDAVQLSKKLTEWSVDKQSGMQKYFVFSGGGPGMMEAANRGAFLAGGKSAGLNISIPLEQFPNEYISDELNFEFHYFFMRKFWFIYFAKAIVVFPGGFGTIDELAEALTLTQTRKIKRKLPILIYGSEYWHDIIDMDKMVEWGTISKEDLDLLYFSDNVDDAFRYITKSLES